jgi:hypothetical protein
MAIGMVCDFSRALLVHCIAHVTPLLECWQTYVAPLLECWKTVVVPTLSCLHIPFKQLWASICLGWGSIFFLLPFCLLNCTQRRFTNWGRLARVLVLQYLCSWLPTVKFDSIGIPISFSTIMHIVVLIFTIFADDYRKQGIFVCIDIEQYCFMNVMLIHLAGLSEISNIMYTAKVIVIVCVDDFLKPGTFVRISLN